MKKVAKNTWYVSVPIYHAGLYLCTTAKAVTKLCAKNDMEYDPDIVAGRCIHVEDVTDGCNYIIVYIENHEEDTVVHESVHAAWYILDCMGVELSADNHESLAYLTEWVYNQFRPHAVYPDE